MMVYAGLMGGSETPKDIDAMLERVPPLDEEGRAFAEEIAEGVKERAEELDALSEREHEATGRVLDYKQMDINNVVSLCDVLRYGAGTPEKKEPEEGSVR